MEADDNLSNKSSSSEDPVRKLSKEESIRIKVEAAERALANAQFFPPQGSLQRENMVILDAAEAALYVHEFVKALEAGKSTFQETRFMTYYNIQLEHDHKTIFHSGKILHLNVPASLENALLETKTNFFLRKRLKTFNIVPEKYINYADFSSNFIFHCLRRDTPENQVRIYSMMALVLLMCNESLEKYLKKSINTTELNTVFQCFVCALEGKRVKLDAVSTTFENFEVIYNVLVRLRKYFVIHIKLDMPDFIEGVKMVFTSMKNQFDAFVVKRPLDTIEYMSFKQFTTGVDSFCRLAYTFNKLDIATFIDIDEYKQMEDCARKVCRLSFDIATFYANIDNETENNNFILIKRKELDCSLDQAFLFTVTLLNRLLVKMIVLNDRIRWNDELLKSIPHIQYAVTILMEYSQGCMDFTYISRMFKQNSRINAEREIMLRGNVTKLVQEFVIQ